MVSKLFLRAIKGNGHDVHHIHQLVVIKNKFKMLKLISFFDWKVVILSKARRSVYFLVSVLKLELYVV